jgi:hypothetical protein
MLRRASAAGLFASSIQLFRSSLNEHQKELFTEPQDVSELFAELKQTSEQHKKSSKLLVCCQRLQRFSAAFEPYFDIVNIFVQVKPDWFGVFWGSIRLIFKV